MTTLLHPSSLAASPSDASASDAAPATATPRFAGRTYARARLWLGITGVGTQVLLAAGTLAADLPARLLPADPAASLTTTVGAALAALLVPVALLAPLDLLGGRVVVRRPPTPAAWLGGWARGVGVQLLVWAAAAAALVAAARAGGPLAVVAAVVALQAALLLVRGPLARLVAPFALTTPDVGLADDARAAGLDPADVRVAGTPDESFVGGWMGARGGRLWVPAAWRDLAPTARRGALARRVATRATGLHARGVALALAWNTAGVALSLGATGADARTAAGLVTLVAATTLWSFVGLLVLPTPSRRAVYAIDAAAAAAHGAAPVREALAALDARQDDEPTRARGIETIFHPIPARAARLAALSEGAMPNGSDERATLGVAFAAHQAARHALYLAWGLLSPLARAVHCNVGRPALWVVWPGD